MLILRDCRDLSAPGGIIELQEQVAAPDDRTSTVSGPGPVRREGVRVIGSASFLVPAVFSLALGLWGITRAGTMWRDESVTYQVSHRSLSEIYGLLQHADIVHGLYYIFMHSLFSVWEGGLVALRLPSVLATSVTAGLVGVIALKLTARRSAGLLSGLAFAVIPEVQMYSQEGRSYAMVSALVAVSTYFFLTLMVRPTKARWLAYGLAILAASLLHEFAVLTLLAHGVTVYRSQLVGRARRHFVISAGGVLLALLPLVLISTSQSAQVSWIGNPKLRDWFEIVGAALVAAWCARYLSRARRSVEVARLALPLAVLPTVALLLAAVYDPMYVDRYVLYSNIGFALLVGTSLAYLADDAKSLQCVRHQKARACIVALLAIAFTAAMLPVTLQMRTPESRKDNVTAIATEVDKMSHRGDAVLFAPARRREWMLSYPEHFKGLTDIALKGQPRTSGTLEGVERPAADIRLRLARAKRVVVLSDPKGQPLDTNAQESAKREIIERDFTECQRKEIKGGQVTLYVRSGPC